MRAIRNIFCSLTAVGLGLTVAIPATGASFDCRNASSGVEKTICADPQLSALDESLAASYRALMASAGASGILRTDQRGWARQRSYCMRDQVDANTCLRELYTTRNGEFDQYLTALRNPQSGTQRFSLKKASKEYDLTLRMLDNCEDAERCAGPAIVDIRRKGSRNVLQSILVPKLEFHLEEGAPLFNSNALYEYGGAVNVKDYNFDGKPDIALQTGNEGPYNGPSYDIFLNTGDGFRHSEELTALSSESLNSLGVEGRQLVTWAKGGCCLHSRTWYRVVHDKPVPVRRVNFDDLSVEHYTLRVEERWKNGKWIRISTKKERRQD